MRRKLSRLEQSMISAPSEMPIQFTTTARLRGVFTLDQLQAALAKLRRRHPLSAIRVMLDEQGQGWLTSEDVPEYPLRVMDGAHDEKWLQEVHEELCAPFSWQTGPPVRFVWMRYGEVSDLILTCHHAIADGLSGAYGMRDLLHYLGHPEAEVEPLPFVPRFEELIPPEIAAAISPEMIAAEINRFVEPSGSEDGSFAHVQQEELKPPRYHIRAWSLSKAQTGALMTRAKQERTTVQGALGVAYLRAFGAITGNGQAWQWQRTLQSPINLRVYLAKPIGEGFGCFIHIVKTRADCSPERDFWQVAREVREGLLRETTPEKLFGGAIIVAALLASDRPAEEIAAILRRMGMEYMKHDYDLSLSNLGRLNIPAHYGSLTLESLYGPTFSSFGDYIVGVNTTGGQMFCTCIHRDTTLDAAAGEQIRVEAMRQLDMSVND